MPNRYISQNVPWSVWEMAQLFTKRFGGTDIIDFTLKQHFQVLAHKPFTLFRPKHDSLEFMLVSDPPPVASA